LRSRGDSASFIDPKNKAIEHLIDNVCISSHVTVDRHFFAGRTYGEHSRKCLISSVQNFGSHTVIADRQRADGEVTAN
jgi:hypothetical protein